ncbi:hypothetical protein [uncultured Cytophaga sp.]|uniref:hypothetical protein n=1 Tax=uncultured Cytophaga sp. TaxID=160238 RepID=UPI00260DAFB1|nr:hypothetical protein [uncultured Cytophaga sp.]
MDKKFLDNIITNNNQLKGIILVLAIMIFFIAYGNLGGVDLRAYFIITILRDICSLIGIYYLYVFVRFELKQKISLFIFVIYLLTIAYFLFMNTYLLVLSYVRDAEIVSIYKKEVYQYIPIFFVYASIIGISIQLLLNTCSGKIGKALKLIGVFFIIESISLFVSLNLLYGDFYSIYSFFLTIIYILPYMAMIYLYALVLNQPIVEEKI